MEHSTVATPQFTLAYERFEPAEEGLREALTSTGNGYFCTRGAAEWEDADDVHYPGTYAHGGYNRETTIMGGRPVLNEDLVNLPNWLVLKLRIEGEEPIGLPAQSDHEAVEPVRDCCGRRAGISREPAIAFAHRAKHKWRPRGGRDCLQAVALASRRSGGRQDCRADEWESGSPGSMRVSVLDLSLIHI